MFTAGSYQQLSFAQQSYLQAARSASSLVSSCSEQVPGTLRCTTVGICRLHNLAHVELNAVDLAWDTVARFSHLALDQVSQTWTPVPRQALELALHACAGGTACIRALVVFVCSKPYCLAAMVQGRMYCQQPEVVDGQQADCLPSASLGVISMPQVNKHVWSCTAPPLP